MRLDHYLVRRLPAQLSRNQIQRAIRAGSVISARGAIKANDKLRAGDAITASFEELPAPGTDTALIPQPIPLEIVYEDASVLLVNKAAGLVTHPAPGHWDGTLVNAILWHLGHQESEAGSQKSELARAGIVHRLDKDTSGLLLVAKTERAHIALSRQLKARTMHRRYLAVVEGHVPINTGTVDIPIGRHALHRKIMTVRHIGGRHAVTHYRVIKRLECLLQDSAASKSRLNYTVLDVALDTGRTHQIRVHMAHVGHPVLGDRTYGKHAQPFWDALGIGRQLLHAYGLAFQHPQTGKSLVFWAKPPEDFDAWCDEQAMQRIEAVQQKIAQGREKWMK